MPKLVLLWLSAGFIAGIVIAGEASFVISLWQLSIGIIAGVLIAFFLKKKNFLRSVFVVLLVTAFLLGMARYQSEEVNPQSGKSVLSLSECKSCNMHVIVQEPSREYITYSETKLKLVQYQDKDGVWHSEEAILVMRLPASFHFEYHTQITLQGELVSAIKPGEKPHTSWLKRNRVDYQIFYPTISSVTPPSGSSFIGNLYELKTTAYHVLQTLMPFPESELMAGILLGIESRIPEYLREAYRLTGTAHIIAISGFNISLLANTISRVFHHIFPSRIGALISIITIAIYTVLVGAQPAVLRAALMGILAIPAYLIGRKIIGVHALAIAAACMALENPYILWDTGFQLSFCATFGILTFIDYFTEKTDIFLNKIAAPSQKWLLGIIKENTLTTLCAQIATLPILFKHFGELPLIAPLVNMLILPLQPGLMLSGGIALVAGLIFYPFGRIMGLLTWILAAFNDQIILLFAQIPLTITLEGNLWYWIGIGINLLLLVHIFQEKKKYGCEQQFT